MRLKHLAIVLTIAFACSFALSAPSFGEEDAVWTTSELPGILSGDVPVCASVFTSQEATATGRLRLLANQDSPLWGKTSRAEKRVQFEYRIFSAESINVALFAELTGRLRIEGGIGEVTVRATTMVLDAVSLVPIPGLEISASTAEGQFSRTLTEAGVSDLEDFGVQIASLEAGDYVVVGFIEAIVEISRGWWNYEVEADVLFSVEFLVGVESDEASDGSTTVSP